MHRTPPTTKPLSTNCLDKKFIRILGDEEER
jgi:hypothetical protein